jgi:hypothetical protein
MQDPHWLADNWFTLLNALGVVGGLVFTGYSLHSESKTRKVANLLTLTQGHRDIWREILHDPKLTRILDPAADVGTQPVTTEEQVFVTLVIEHLSVVFHAMRDELTISPEGLRRDVWQFFSLPIPQVVWNRVMVMQDNTFVAFVEACRNWK